LVPHLNACYTYDERFDDRFVDDGVLTGIYRDPFANPNTPPPPPSSSEEEQEIVTNLFESETTLQNEETKFKLYGHPIPILTHQ
jgi:hypothetical protein